MNWSYEDYDFLVYVIRRIVRQEIAENRDDSHQTAFVKSVDTANRKAKVYLASDPNNPLSDIKVPDYIDVNNLSAGDKVQVLCKKGKLNDSWIAMKH